MAKPKETEKQPEYANDIRQPLVYPGSVFKLKAIHMHDAKNLFIPGMSVEMTIDIESPKSKAITHMIEVPSGVEVHFTDVKGQAAMAKIGVGNIQAYYYYPKAKE